MMSSHLADEASFEASFSAFFYRQWLVRRKPVPAGTDLSSQVAIISGSNSGLGFEAGRQLLQLGLSHLILAVRSQSRGDKAADILRKEFPEAKVSVWLLDMSSYDSITALVEKCKHLPKLNMVILNAGLKGGAVFTMVENTGHEYSFQVNYISTALLAILLLPVLKSKHVAGSRRPVLTIVTSDSAFWTSIETHGPILAQLDTAEEYVATAWYQKVKLLQIIFVSKLAAEVNSDDIIINSVNPGLCRGTMFFRNRGDWSEILALMFDMFKWVNARSLVVGASTYVDAAVAKGEESHGSYVSEWAIRPYPKIMYTDVGTQARERLWEETMEELNFAGASDIIQRLKR